MSLSAIAIAVSIFIAVCSGLGWLLGWVLEKGFNGIKEEIKGVREDLKEEVKSLRGDIRERMEHETAAGIAHASHVSACAERHKRLDYEISDIKGKMP